MRKILTLTLVLLSVVAIAKPKMKVALAYVTAGSSVMPDPMLVTHINYAFGTVSKTFDGVEVQNPERLHKIVELKKINPKLSIMLSIGGWESGGFSEMARDEKTRAAFVASCASVVAEFGLDGIDMDWEYPSSSAAGIVSSPDDVDNFTKLMRELRETLGRKKLLTFASASSAPYVDFPSVLPYVDFVNIMAYDMGSPAKYHHSALFPSAMTTYSASQCVEAHLAKGVPPHKLTLGVPFYGHGNTKKGYPYFVSYNARSRFDGMREMWDDQAKVPYLIDQTDEMIYCYDNPRSLALKGDYARQKGLLGLMYWEYAGDDAQGSLRDAVYYSVFPKKNKEKIKK